MSLGSTKDEYERILLQDVTQQSRTDDKIRT